MTATRGVWWSTYLGVSAALLTLTTCKSPVTPAAGSMGSDAGRVDAGGRMDAATTPDSGSPGSEPPADSGTTGRPDSAADGGATPEAGATDLDDSGAGDAYCSGIGRLLFRDAFETAALAWTICEEIVGTGCSVCGSSNHCPQTSCYGSGLASLGVVDGALRVGAGREQAKPSRQSDHVIAGHTLMPSALDEVVWYRLTAMIPAGSYTTGQTGPEFSVQSTDAAQRTFTGGVQYLANMFDRAGHWNLWSSAGWHDLTAALELDATPLAPDTTYEIALGIDFAAHAYVGFRVGVRGGPVSFALSRQQLAAYPITPEAKGFEPSTVITLEAENRHNGCNPANKPMGDGMSYVYSVTYDDVVLCASSR